jgi:hypothetical protein
MATTKRSTGSSSKSTASRTRSTASKSASARNGSAKTRAQSPKARTTRSRAKATGTTSTNGAGRTKSTASSRGTAQSRNGSTRSTTARSSANGSSRNGSRAGTASQMQDRVTGKLKQTGTAVRHAADKAGGPTITVAAAVAGIAGGLALRGRHSSTHDGVTARSMAMLHDVDPAAVLGGLGKATVQLSQRSRSVARDIERVAEQAERLGKILS